MDIFENQPCDQSEKGHTDAAFDNNNSILDLSRREITCLQPEIFTDCNIESLDLSNNRLQNLPKGVKLPLLKKLDLSNNEIRDIYFLSEYSSLEELNVNGNPQLQLSDKFLLVSLLPKLKLIDGVDCSPMRAEIDKLDLQIDEQIDKECQKELSTALYSATFDCNNFKRCLELKVKSIDVDVDKRKALNYKIERKVKAKVEEEYCKLKARFETNKCETEITNTKERRDENVGEKKSPISVESNYSVPPRKREVPDLTETLKCDTKRSRSDMDSGKFDYDAMLFIRCHSSRNDPYDCQTQVWKAAFAPRTKSNTDSDFVASCGGNIVCLIDCVTATVKKRYCDANTNERFFCLAWTVVPRNGESQNLTLAVGGSESYIVLLDGVDLICFCKFKAHEKDVNTLLFHPTKPTWLLSGSYDQRIKVWDIDDPSREKNKAPKLLLEVHSHNFLLQLVYSEKHNMLLAAGEDGLTFWPNFSLDKKEPNLGHVIFPKNKLIDGLAIFPENEDLVAVKRSRTGIIDVINLRVLLNDYYSSQIRTPLQTIRRTPFKSCLQFEYSTTTDDYMYLAVEKGLMVCGDQRGRLWMYDTRNIPFHTLKEKHTSKISPNLILKWPAINNPTHKEKKIVDEKHPIVNAVTISRDLNYVVAVTNINLVCLWKRTTDS